MKNFLKIFATAMLALFFVACPNEDDVSSSLKNGDSSSSVTQDVLTIDGIPAEFNGKQAQVYLVEIPIVADIILNSFELEITAETMDFPIYSTSTMPCPPEVNCPREPLPWTSTGEYKIRLVLDDSLNQCNQYEGRVNFTSTKATVNFSDLQKIDCKSM